MHAVHDLGRCTNVLRLSVTWSEHHWDAFHWIGRNVSDVLPQHVRSCPQHYLRTYVWLFKEDTHEKHKQHESADLPLNYRSYGSKGPTKGEEHS